MKWELGGLVSNSTIIKDGVDLKERFFKVLEGHPFANMCSNAAKRAIASELYEAVMQDSMQKREGSEWREKIEFKNAEKGNKRTSR
tara:strand:- start:92 stop:349 length:258 start_codon:yes stop_codon:yes gene_type:complete